MREMHLFAGAGGGILGGMLLGHTPVCAVEIEPFCQEVLRQRQRDGILPEFPIYSDIKEFDGTPWRGKVDVVAGGFPCQDISSAGKGKGIHGERSSLFFELARVVREVGPRYVFLENSPMLIHRGLDVVLGTLADMGYDAAWGVISAADCGANHLRKRVWILGYSDSAPTDALATESSSRESVGQSGCDVAHVSSGWGSPGELRTGRDVARVCGENVADAPSKGLQGLGGERRLVESRGEVQAARSCQDVAHSLSSRLEGLPGNGKDLDGQGWLFAEQERSACESGLCGGGDSTESGHSQPGLGRVVDGLAPGLDCHYMETPDWWQAEPEIPRVSPSQPNRVHRLKALGNGQVPRVAATAWVVLEKILRGESQ